ncbi:MAG TPA: SpoIIE family protein phosphatase [Candidatus Sulfomarinibacteraceae bacterium]|nr:SpoIIE family protein phosphatase [Candidatus Sulfomarinibacteraceae bacterium]
MTDREKGRGSPSPPTTADSAATEAIQAVLSRWRARAVRLILAFIAIIGLPAWGSVILNGIRSGEMSPLLWVYLFVYLALAALAFLPRIDPRLRIWGLLLLGYANGCASMVRLGLTGSGRIYLLLIPLFTTILVGTRAGLATAMLSLATYAFFAAQAGSAAAPSWVEAGLALTAFMLTTVILLARFSQFQLQILHRERRARSQLEAARAELEAYSHTLEEKVLERTARLDEARQQAEAANRRFEQELAFAGRIQASFMASELPQLPSWQFAAALVPARETSGDFYDVFPLPDSGERAMQPDAGATAADGHSEPGTPSERYAILIADVVDKGVGAALFMALCWALLHTYARRYPDDPARVLSAANRRILRDTHAGQFVTVFYGVLDAHTGVLRYANAGHPPPFRLRRGELSTLARTGIPLGILEDAQWKEQTLNLQPGDLCFLYTDGVTEAQDRRGDFFEGQRLANLLRHSAGHSAQEVTGAVLDEVARFAGGVAQADDITLLALAHKNSLTAGK